ncbi:MAG: homoserine dehydrogenase, partial [Candidatus Aminicenantes bacterium]|nr:homoserine dehydrogenase [Candidatus Aminicenantes bacterium]
NMPGHLIREGREPHQALKLLGIFSREQEQPYLQVKPSILDSAHPLFGVNDTNKGITFFTDTMSTVTVTGGKSDPRGAAAALLKDIINIYR